MSSRPSRAALPQAPDDLVDLGAGDRPRGGAARSRSGPARRARRGQASAAERADALLGAATSLAEAAEDVAELIVREVGKTIVEARMEVGRGVSHPALPRPGRAAPRRRHPSADPTGARGHADMSRRRPRGVAGLITPWNFPVAIPLWKAASGAGLRQLGAAQAGLARRRRRAARLPSCSSRISPTAYSRSSPAGAETGQAVDRAGRRRLVHRVDRGRPQRRRRPRRRGECPHNARWVGSTPRSCSATATRVGGEGDRRLGDGLCRPEVHGDQARDRGRRLRAS